MIVNRDSLFKPFENMQSNSSYLDSSLSTTAPEGRDVNIMSSLQEFFHESELRPIMMDMKNMNITSHNETLTFLLNLLNNSKVSTRTPLSFHPCDVGFRDGYQIIHGYLSLIVCILGGLSNALNIIILTRREMVNSTNTILTGLAVADLLVLLEYASFAIMYITDEYRSKSYGHAVYILFHAHFTQVTHTVAISLTITLAVWRYIAICKPHLNLVLCTLPRSRIAVSVAYILSPILNIPNYLMLTINTANSSSNHPLYLVDFTERAKNGILQSVHFWLYSVLVKLLPCFLLTMLIYHIIRAMYNAKRRKQNLMNLRSPSMDYERRIPRMERLTEKTTRMLLTVLVLFLITELPQGILSFLSGVYGHNFFRECYLHWGDFMDLLALLNSAINFFLYYIMSQQFRLTLQHLFFAAPPLNLSPRVHGTTVSTQL
ncbi:UNVERIFIED_CONTAM: hypothetical protein RMT77_003619 [Armadillidium vulgare]